MGVDDVRKKYKIPGSMKPCFLQASASMLSVIDDALDKKWRELPNGNSSVKPLSLTDIAEVFETVDAAVPESIDKKPYVGGDSRKAKKIYGETLGPEGRKELFYELLPKAADRRYNRFELPEELQAPEA